MPVLMLRLTYICVDHAHAQLASLSSGKTRRSFLLSHYINNRARIPFRSTQKQLLKSFWTCAEGVNSIMENLLALGCKKFVQQFRFRLFCLHVIQGGQSLFVGKT